MAKIAVELDRAVARRAADGSPGSASARPIARGPGWSVDDVLCTSGPHDRVFEEQHSRVRIAMVIAGTFEYRSSAGRELMMPGSILLGNAGQCFECGHRHAAGDRCISFGYDPEYFEGIAADAGGRPEFTAPRLPAIPELSPVFAQACAGLTIGEISWEELAIKTAARSVQLGRGLSAGPSAPAGAESRVTRIVRMIERTPDADLSVSALAKCARLSPYHFLRTFEAITGLTPHQYVLRTRLREAAIRLSNSKAKILDIALDCGFGDVSNFNRAFRTEFGMSPRMWGGLQARGGLPVRPIPTADSY